MSYTKKRYITYILITLFIMGTPFVTIDGNHLLLLSFERLQFHFLGFVFNVNELFIMPFLLMLLFIGIFAVTSVFGRVWCGWACPQTIFRVLYRDLIEGTLLDLTRIKNKQKSADYSKVKNIFKKAVAITLWSILSIIIATNFILYFIPTEDFFFYMQTPSEHIFMIIFILSIAGFLIFDIIVMKENFCQYVCPYSRVQSVLYDDDTKQVVYDTNRGGDIYNSGEKSILNVKQWSNNEECTTCEACVKVCPTHIDIRKGFQFECINCLECSDACSTVMGKLGKKSLINWGSTNSVLNKIKNSIYSKKNIMYLVAIILSIVFTAVYTKKQEPILAQFNKTTKLYNIKSDGIVTNNYVLTIRNNQKEKYSYDIKIDDERFFIKRFQSKKIDANKQSKFILIIGSKKRLKLSDTDTTVLSLKAKIFAKENPAVNIERKISFIYPRNDAIK
ncbi:MAG: cytochrome c oxidase accessory protein CcoG [Arcobacteraceae bacterium]